ncbi:hypothetical protein [Streptomyces sp. NPDC001978]|uniref:hypothetical protein n=1 Tax=Streptomyces sp. NPDC001978 TaxID=3364627 RepID=UPI003697D09E
MTDFEESYLTLVEPSAGDEIRYRTDVFYEDAEDSIDYPGFDHPRVIDEVHEQPDGEHGPVTLFYVLASAPTVTAFAAMVRAFILRNKDRKVVVHGRSGKVRLEVTGDFSAEEIERLLRAQMEEGDGSRG